MRYEWIYWLSSLLTTDLCITVSHHIALMSWRYCHEMMDDNSDGSALYVTGPSLQCCTVHRVALPELTDVLWHQTAAHSLCIITKQLLTTTESSCRMDPDSSRHTDLFNVVPLNAVSCATHNADTNRKSLSVCLTVWDAENVFGLWTPSRRLTRQSMALAVSVRCVYNEPGRDAVIPLDVTVS